MPQSILHMSSIDSRGLSHHLAEYVIACSTLDKTVNATKSRLRKLLNEVPFRDDPLIHITIILDCSDET